GVDLSIERLQAKIGSVATFLSGEDGVDRGGSVNQCERFPRERFESCAVDGPLVAARHRRGVGLEIGTIALEGAAKVPAECGRIGTEGGSQFSVRREDTFSCGSSPSLGDQGGVRVGGLGTAK